MPDSMGRQFGKAAEKYHLRRPRYPRAVFDQLAAGAGLRPQDPVLEVGAGTGIATLELARLGLAVTALEPDPEMARLARRELSGHQQCHLEQTGFEVWVPNARTYRAVVSAQAWHWVAPEIRYRKAADVLTQGGSLALIWNRVEGADGDLRARLDDLYGRLAPEVVASPPGERDLDRTVEIQESGCFEVQGVWRFPFVTRYGPTEFSELMATQSDHVAMEPDRRDRLLEAVAGAIEAGGGSYRVGWATTLYLARRI